MIQYRIFYDSKNEGGCSSVQMTSEEIIAMMGKIREKFHSPSRSELQGMPITEIWPEARAYAAEQKRIQKQSEEYQDLMGPCKPAY